MSLLKPRSSSSPPPQKSTTTNDSSDAAASPPPLSSPPDEEDKHHKEILERLTTVENMVSQINGRMTALEEVTRSAQFRVDTNIREIMGHIIRDELSQLAPDDDDKSESESESESEPDKPDETRHIRGILNAIMDETKTYLDEKDDETGSEDTESERHVQEMFQKLQELALKIGSHIDNKVSSDDNDDELQQKDNDDPSTLPTLSPFHFRDDRSDAEQEDSTEKRRVELEAKRIQEIRELLRDYQMSPPKTTRKKELIDMLLSAETK